MRTRLLRLSPTFSLSETFLTSPDDAPALEKELATGCDGYERCRCLLDNHYCKDLFKEVRCTKTNVEQTCGSIDLAFAVSGRTYILSHALRCKSNAFSATLAHKLSGEKPKLVFKLEGEM